MEIRARATLLVTLNDGLRISGFLLENRERFEQKLALGCHWYICVCEISHSFVEGKAQPKISNLYTPVSFETRALSLYWSSVETDILIPAWTPNPRVPVSLFSGSPPWKAMGDTEECSRVCLPESTYFNNTIPGFWNSSPKEIGRRGCQTHKSGMKMTKNKCCHSIRAKRCVSFSIGHQHGLKVLPSPASYRAPLRGRAVKGLCLGFGTQAHREGANQEPQKWAFSGWESVIRFPGSWRKDCFKSLLSSLHPTHIQGWNADLRAADASLAAWPSPPSQDCDYLITAGIWVESRSSQWRGA